MLNPLTSDTEHTPKWSLTPQGLLQQMDVYYAGLRVWLKERKEAKERADIAGEGVLVCLGRKGMLQLCLAHLQPLTHCALLSTVTRNHCLPFFSSHLHR